MKAVVILVVVLSYICLIAEAQQCESRLDKAVKKCLSCAKSDDSSKLLSQWKFPPNDEGKCFVNCCMKEFGLLLPDGSLNIEVLKAMFKTKGIDVPKEVPDLQTVPTNSDQFIEKAKAFVQNNLATLQTFC